MKLYINKCNSSLVHFMQCRLGCAAQKATTLLYSNSLAGTLNQLQGLYCQHGSEAHKAPARGMDKDGLYVSTAYASWPPRLSAIFALAIADAGTLEPTPIHDATIISVGTQPANRWVHPRIRDTFL